MAYIIETKNIFEPTKVTKHIHPGGITIREWLQITYPGFVEFPTPTICQLNGKYFPLREEWGTTVIHKDDVVIFATSPPQGIELIAIIATVVIVALSVAFALVVEVPTTPGELPASDPVFSTRGQQNTIRLGEPIEVCYGRNRIYPSLATRPFFQYVDNDQFQYSVFCLGQGHFEIHDIFIGDTPIDDFDEVEYEIVEPGGEVTIFPTSVFTSIEAGGQELFGPNEDEYVAPGYEGPFAANPAGTDIVQIQVDLVFPRGLYRINDDGEVRPAQIEVQIEYREIDDAGSPVGAGTWAALTSPATLLFLMSTITPQRRTITSAALPAGRYEVRIRRTTITVESNRAGHQIVWESLKGFATFAENWPDVTLLAVAIRASSNLNERTQTRFNVVATRKLPIYDSVSWSIPTETRSIVWAFVDVFMALYGGRVTVGFFDWDALLALDAVYTARDEHFDWIFRDPITIWEAAKVIARVGRATPLLVGSLITMKRDGPVEVPTAFFAPDNMVAGSFSRGVKLWDLNEHDSLRIEYIDPDTGYKPEQVVVTLPGGTTDNPEDLRIPGIQSRDHAFREGLYTLAVERYLRENITFDTGLEGHIPTYGDLILIAHDVPEWGQSGYVVHAEYVSSNQYRLWVSEMLDWSAVGAKVISLRGNMSQILGPYTAVIGDNEMQVLVTIPGSTGDFNFMLGGESEPMLFLFGIEATIAKPAKIVRIEPQGGEVVRLVCVNYDPDIYDMEEDSAIVMPDDPPSVDHPPDTVTPPLFLYLTQVEGPPIQVQASWSPVPGAMRYIVETSSDGESWTEIGQFTQTGILIPASPGILYVRVAGITDQGIGAWIQEDITIQAGTALELLILDEWDNDLEWQVGWMDTWNVLDWIVRVYDNRESGPVLKHTYTRTWDRRFEYTYLDAQLDDNITREMRVEVQARYVDPDVVGIILAHDFSNAIPDAPTAPASEIMSGGELPTEVYYLLSWVLPEHADLYRVKVWVSDTNGFDPDVVTPVEDIQIPYPFGHGSLPEEVSVSIPLTAGAHAVHYWRVGVVDVWGEEVGITAQQTIPAYS